MANDNNKKIKQTCQSPCVRNCCLDDDDMCLGCFRYIQEITSWQSFSEQKKQQVIVACQQRRDNARRE